MAPQATAGRKPLSEPPSRELVLKRNSVERLKLENAPLSQARGDAVLRIFAATGVDAVTFSVQGVGVDDPASSGTSDLDKARNRRTSLRVRIADQANAGSGP